MNAIDSGTWHVSGFAIIGVEHLDSAARVRWVIVQPGGNFYIVFASMAFYCLKDKKVQRLKKYSNMFFLSRDGQYIARLSASNPDFHC